MQRQPKSSNGILHLKKGFFEKPACFRGIQQASQTKCECACDTLRALGIEQDTGKGTVNLHSGESYLHVTDLEIPGRGFNWKFERTYRSGIIFDGPLGSNWEFNYNRRLLVEPQGSVIRMDGYGRADKYQVIDGRYSSPDGFYTRMTRNPDNSFIERDRNNNQVLYAQPDENGISHMMEFSDRNGNRMQFRYDSEGHLISVIDTYGRVIKYSYDYRSRLVEVEDFIGRKIRFEYDSNNDLVSVHLDFQKQKLKRKENDHSFSEDGRITRYEYSSRFSDDNLNHCLLKIIAPNEALSTSVPYLQLDYVFDPSLPNTGRVSQQTLGSVNDSGINAGGTISYEYIKSGSGVTDDIETPILCTSIKNRNGYRSEYHFNQNGNILRIKKMTNLNIRRGNPKFFETRFDYNQDGEIKTIARPEGNTIEYVYDEQNLDRLQQGNLLAEIRKPDKNRGGDQKFVKMTYTYEPLYNQRKSITEARGNDPEFIPQNSDDNSIERYTTHFIFDYQEGSGSITALAKRIGLKEHEVNDLLNKAGISLEVGDVNNDGVTDQVSGNIVKTIFPTVNLSKDSNIARIQGSTKQHIDETFTYNKFGQITSKKDAERNSIFYKYYPEDKPSDHNKDTSEDLAFQGGGYLRQVIRNTKNDPIPGPCLEAAPRPILLSYSYDKVGNLTKQIDGMGVVTEYVIDGYNQTTTLIRAADVNGQNKGEIILNNTREHPEYIHGMNAFRYQKYMFYDSNGNLIKEEVENRNSNNQEVVGDTITREYRYDILNNMVETIKQISNNQNESIVTKYRYDRNENRVLEISPVANLTPGHPQFQPNNVLSYVFDERDLLFTFSRGGLTRLFMTLEAHSDIPERISIHNNDASAVTYRYDGNGNLIEIIDVADPKDTHKLRVTNHFYNGFDNKVSTVDAVGNQTFLEYDPAGNLLRLSRFGRVHGPSPKDNSAATFRQPFSINGFTTQSLLRQTEFRYDELNRLYEECHKHFAYDQVKYKRDPISGLSYDNESNNWEIRRFEYDRKGRLIFQLDEDRMIQTSYNGMDWICSETDAGGNEIQYTYDGNGNIIKTAEFESTQRESVEMGRIPDIRETFTTIYVYDSLNQLIRVTDNLGQTTRFSYDSRGNLILISDAQHSDQPTDLIEDPLHLFPAAGQSSHGVTKINLAGNTIQNFYDGNNRIIARVYELRNDGQGKNPIDTANPFNPDGLITIDYQWDPNGNLTAVADDGSTPGNQNNSIGIIEESSPKGNVTRYVYDEFNRRIREIYSDGSIQGYDYGSPLLVDQMERIVDPNGSQIYFLYDSIGLFFEKRFVPASSSDPHPFGGFKDRSLNWQVIGTRTQYFGYDGEYRLTNFTDR
jgi:YD repeat-containing protein